MNKSEKFVEPSQPLDPYDSKLIEYIRTHQMAAEHLRLQALCHSVEDAAQAVQAAKVDFVKNVCMIDEAGRLLVAIVKGEDRASTSRVGKALLIPPPRLALEEEMLELAGYPAGGIPSFGYNALFIIDPKVLEREFVYTGGGSPYSLTRISVQEMLQVNQAIVARVRK